MQKHKNYNKNVFINCPFDDEYFELLHPLIFTIIYFNFELRLFLESSDSGQSRLEKIITLIRESRYAIHDLSRLQAKSIDEYYRLNMPFELGLDFGLIKREIYPKAIRTDVIHHVSTKEPLPTNEIHYNKEDTLNFN